MTTTTALLLLLACEAVSSEFAPPPFSRVSVANKAPIAKPQDDGKFLKRLAYHKWGLDAEGGSILRLANGDAPASSVNALPTVCLRPSKSVTSQPSSTINSPETVSTGTSAATTPVYSVQPPPIATAVPTPLYYPRRQLATNITASPVTPMSVGEACDFPNVFDDSFDICNSKGKLYGLARERLRLDDDDFQADGFNIPKLSFKVTIPCGSLDPASIRVIEIAQNTTSDYITKSIQNATTITTDLNIDAATSTNFYISGGLSEGLHLIAVMAMRTNGEEFYDTKKLVFGTLPLEIEVSLPDGTTPAGNATVKMSLTKDPTFSVSATTDSNGIAKFKRLPPFSMTLDIQYSGMVHVEGVMASSGKIVVTMEPFVAVSEVDNLDFSQGLAGWQSNKPDAVTLIPHADDISAPATSIGSQAAKIPRLFGNTVRALPSGKLDLKVSTKGPGSSKIAYSSKVPKGFNAIVIRHKFVTAEFPKYFGTEFDDSYSISITSAKTGKTASTAISMNLLGAGAFKTLAVTNVADGLVDSAIVLEKLFLAPVAAKPNCGAEETMKIEGRCSKCYMDDKGIPSIGVGLNLLEPTNRKLLRDNRVVIDDTPTLIKTCLPNAGPHCVATACAPDEHNCMSQELAQSIYEATSCRAAQNIAEDFAPGMPGRAGVTGRVKAGVTDMAFMGKDGLGQFKNLKEALTKGDFASASYEVMNSQWCRDVHEPRCSQTTQCISSGA
ncbi:hypothetical protein HDU97_008511 [Phlyctochytrium planicorne]|nr:hypothetical protein HDU97_008511 [Phlyctochytrium planicorne]